MENETITRNDNQESNQNVNDVAEPKKLSVKEIKKIVAKKLTDILGRFLGIVYEKTEKHEKTFMDLLDYEIKQASEYNDFDDKSVFIYDVATRTTYTLGNLKKEEDENYDPFTRVALSIAVKALSGSSSIKFSIKSPLFAFSLLQGNTEYYISFSKLKESFKMYDRNFVTTISSDGTLDFNITSLVMPFKHTNISESHDFCLGGLMTTMQEDFNITKLLDLTKVRDLYLTHNRNSAYIHDAIDEECIKDNELQGEPSSIDILIKSMFEDNSKEDEKLW